MVIASPILVYCTVSTLARAETRSFLGNRNINRDISREQITLVYQWSPDADLNLYLLSAVVLTISLCSENEGIPGERI